MCVRCFVLAPTMFFLLLLIYKRAANPIQLKPSKQVRDDDTTTYLADCCLAHSLARLDLDLDLDSVWI